MLPSISSPAINKIIVYFKSFYYLSTDILKVNIARIWNLYSFYGLEDKVSVIIPTYNRKELLLKRALPSVLSQTHRNLEVIVISHGCTDGTDQAVNELSKFDSRIKLLKIKRKKLGFPSSSINFWLAGPVKPINAGLKASRGKWIARIDDDDVWLENHIKSSLRFALTNNLEFVSSAYRVKKETKSYVVLPEGSPKIGGVQTWLYKSYLKNIYANIDCWRKSWNRVNDTDLQNRFVRARVKIGSLNQVGAIISPRDGESEVGSKAYILNEKKYEEFYQSK